MWISLLAGIFALLGTIVGGVVTYWTQTRIHRDEVAQRRAFLAMQLPLK